MCFETFYPKNKKKEKCFIFRNIKNFECLKVSFRRIYHIWLFFLLFFLFLFSFLFFEYLWTFRHYFAIFFPVIKKGWGLLDDLFLCPALVFVLYVVFPHLFPDFYSSPPSQTEWNDIFVLYVVLFGPFYTSWNSFNYPYYMQKLTFYKMIITWRM